MKKLLLLSLSLFAMTLAQANIIVDLVYKIADQEVAAVVLTSDDGSLIYDFGTVKYRVVINLSQNEEGQIVTSLDVFEIKDDVENLIAQPTTVGLPATVAYSNSNGESLIINIHE